MEVARIIVGIIGNAISPCIFLSPAPTFYGTITKKATEEVEPYLLQWTFLNSIFWINYSNSTVDKFLFFFNNVIVYSIETVYFTLYVQCVKGGKRWFVAGSIGFQCLILLVLAFVAKHHVLLSLGIVCDVSSVTVYVSHLVIWKRVMDTKTVEVEYFWLAFADLSNGICWTIYGLLYLDIFIMVSSGLGAICGAIQMGLYAYFYGNKKVTRTEEVIGGEKTDLV